MKRWWLLAFLGSLWLPALQAQDVVKVPVQVAVTDVIGQPLEGASVSLRAPSASRTATTDGKGVASFEVSLGSAVTFSVEASKPGYSTKTESRELGPADRAGVRLELTLSEPDTTVLVVTVRDRAQHFLPNIRVSATHVRMGDMFVERQPEYNGVTGADGVARLAVKTGRYRGEQLLGTELRVEASEQNSGMSDRKRTASKTVTISYRLPSKAVDLMMLDTAQSSDTAHGMPVDVLVLDDGGDKVPGATVTLRGEVASQTRSSTTNEHGVAMVEATVTTARLFDIEVTKNGYNSNKDTIALDPKDRGKGVKQITIGIAKIAIGEQARIDVSVSNGKSKLAVEGAQVRLSPLDGVGPTLRGSTGADGRLTLTSSARGAYQLEVSHGSFITHREQVVLERKNGAFTVALAENQRQKEDAKVEVFVSASDKQDAKGRPAPIAGARLDWGNSSTYTDSEGKAVITFTEQLGVSITVDAPGYKPKATSVDGGRYVVVKSYMRRVQLDPADATDTSPFNLVIRVVDAQPPHAPVPNAAFQLQLPDGRSLGDFNSGATGEVTIGVREQAATLSRQGLTVVVKDIGSYGGSITTIPASMLVPSREPVVFLVQLSKPPGLLDRLKAALDQLRDKAAAAVETEQKKRADEEAPLTLTFEVNESASPYPPVPGARVRLLLSDGRSLGDFVTGSSGAVTAQLQAKDLAQAPYGVAAVVSADRYLDSSFSLSGGLFKPPQQAARYPVLLDKAGLDATIARLKEAQEAVRAKAAAAVAEQKKGDLGDASPLEILVQVEDDAPPYGPVPDARIDLRLADGSSLGFWVTDGDGSVVVRVPPKATVASRKGLTAKVSAPDYASGSFEIEAARLRPSSEMVTYVVPLTNAFNRDLAALEAEAARFEALHNNLNAKHQAAQADLERAKGAADEARQLTENEAKFGKGEPTTWQAAAQQRADANCEAAAKAAAEHVRMSNALARDVVTLLGAAQTDAAACTSFEVAARIDANYRAALEKAAKIKAQGERAHRESNEFLQSAGPLEKIAYAPLEAIRRAAKQAEQAAKSAAQNEQEAKRLAKALEQGLAKALPRFNELRARPAAANNGRVAALGRRLSGFPQQEAAYRWTLAADKEAGTARQWLRTAEKELGSFGKQGCVEARTTYPRAAETVQSNLNSAELELKKLQYLPQRAQECREQVARNGAQPAVAAAPSAPPLGSNPVAPTTPAGPSPWEQIAKAAAAAAPAIAAAIQQSKTRQQPIQPPPPVATGGVPYVVGDTLERAQAKLAAAGLRVGAITRGGKPPAPAQAGMIYHQSPAAGSPLPADRAVGLMQYDTATAAVTPVAPPPPAQGVAQFVGCFVAGKGELNGWAMFHNGMTPAYCVGLCGPKGFKFAGTSNGSTCSCGNGYGALGPSNACDRRCSGDPNQFCGGAFANNVYSTGK